MPAKKQKISRRGFLKKAGKAAAGIVLGAGAATAASGCAPVKFSRMEQLRLVFSSPEKREGLVREKFVQAQKEAIFGKPKPKKANQGLQRKAPAKQPFSRLFGKSTQWPELCSLLNWGLSKDLAKMNLVERVAKKAKASPAQVLLAIKRSGLAGLGARPELDVRILKALETEKRSSRESEALVAETTESVKAKWFAWAKLKRLAGETS